RSIASGVTGTEPFGRTRNSSVMLNLRRLRISTACSPLGTSSTLSPGLRPSRSRISLGTVSWPLLVMVATAMLGSFPAPAAPYLAHHVRSGSVPCNRGSAHGHPPAPLPRQPRARAAFRPCRRGLRRGAADAVGGPAASRGQPRRDGGRARQPL